MPRLASNLRSTSLIDRDALTRLEDWGGPGLVREMIQLYLDNAPERRDQIRDGLERSDIELVERAAHSLKSSSANVGAMAVSDLSRRIEDVAAAGDLAEAAALEPGLREALAGALEALEAMTKDEYSAQEDAS